MYINDDIGGSSLNQKNKQGKFLHNNITYIYFNYEYNLDQEDLNSYYDFDLDNLSKVLRNYVNPGIKYSFLLKARKDDGDYGMAGKQVFFEYNTNDDYDTHVKLLYDKLKENINIFKREYLGCSVEYLIIMFITVRSFPKLEINNIKNLKLNKHLIKIGKTRKDFNSLILPLTMNDHYYGLKLKTIKNKNGIIEFVSINNSTSDNFLEYIKEKSILLNKHINEYIDIKFYLYNNKLGNKYVILNMVDNTKGLNIKEVFDINGNYQILAYDKFITKEIFERKIGPTALTIKDKNVSLIKVKKILSYIKKRYETSVESITNCNIGTFDIETYKHTRDGNSYVYALGYKVYNGEEKKFYLDTIIEESKKGVIGEGSDDLILKCINSMLNSVYYGYKFYVHNMGGFDGGFIYKVLDKYNIDNSNYDYYNYILNPLYRDNRLIRLEIKKRRELSGRKQHKDTVRKEPGFNKIILIDSYKLLPDKLKDLSIAFECDVIKKEFPYTFVNELTLNYVGNTPSIEHYVDVNKNEYNLMKKSNWNLKDETLKYLSDDLNSLMCVIDKFNKYIFRKYDIQMTNSISIARLSLNIFIKHYLEESKIPLINNESLYDFIKQGYYGGITEVYKPYIENGFLYDVNSLYPYSAKNAMPGNECYYIEDIEGGGLNLDELFGFFYCKVKTNNGYFGLLPIHEKGHLILPNGEFEGVWFSEELKFARDNGYEIKVIKGYNFNKIYNVFDRFVDDLYEIKSKSIGAVKAIIKLILNSPYGRFGLSIYKPKNNVVNKERLDYLISTRDCNYEHLYNDRYLVSYNPIISRSRCEEFGLDYIKVLNNEKVDIEKVHKFDNVSISTAAAVTSYARIFMNRIKLLVLSLGGYIYYMDTDSLVTNIELSEDLVGDKLGSFKLEYIIEKGYFTSGKTYCIKGENVKKKKQVVVIKVKGAISKSLSEKHFENMYYNHMSIEAMKNHTKIEYGKGTVNITKIPVKLNHDAYYNRKKIVNTEGLWVDTKPLIINQDFDSKKISSDVNINNEENISILSNNKNETRNM